MLLLERDPLVLTDTTRDTSRSNRSSSNVVLLPQRATLWLWVAVVALMHFDRGAATVAAMDIAGWDNRVANISFGRVVALLAWHSVGLALGSAVAGAAFQQASAKAVLALALLVNAIALLSVSLKPQASLLLIAALRMVSGAAASLPLVFLPLWVDEFSPAEANARWMALVQMGAPLGQFLGVFVATVVTAAWRTSGGLDWHFALFIQALMLVPVAMRVVLIPTTQVEVANVASLRARLDSLSLHPAEGSQLGHLRSVFREMREMMQGVSRNPLTISVSTTLCFLHSTAAGLALWAAPYLALGSSAPPPAASLLCAAVALASAPLVGTYAGAVLCDRFEGFKAGHQAAALRVACAFVALAAIAGPLSGGAAAFGSRLAVVCLWLFGAGAFLPISAGVLMTSMPSYLRSFSSVSSLLMFHLLSFAIVPCIGAALMGCFKKPHEGLVFGVCFALWSTLPAAVLLLMAYAREPKCVAPVGLACADDLALSDIGYELSRRRMSTTPL